MTAVDDARAALAANDESERLKGWASPDNARSLAAALRSLIEYAEGLERDLDVRAANSDHLSAKYWRRARDAEREMHARELHHFEEEQKSAALQARIDEAVRHYEFSSVRALNGIQMVRILKGESEQ